jgi:hypothetical protein
MINKSHQGRAKISIHVEVLKGDPILRIWTVQKRLENVKVIPRNTPLLCAIRDLKQDPILRSLVCGRRPGER